MSSEMHEPRNRVIKFELRDLLEILDRRRRWIALGAAGGLAVGLLSWRLLPPSYEARTTIMVEPQGVPETYIRSTVTLALEQRIDTLRERVTSHDNLNALIEQIGSERLDPDGDLTPEELMEVIRENLEVEIEQRYRTAAVVKLAFTARDPELAADVVAKLSDLYIAENRKDRSRQAASTAQFLEAELAELRNKVTDQEGLIRAFRKSHLGALPDQLEANLRELDRLNLALNGDLEAQQTLLHRISVLQGQKGDEAPGSPSDLGSALRQARVDLAEARRTYTDDHPNVRSLREQIARLERELMESPDSAARPDESLAAVDPALAALQREIDDASISLTSRRREEQHLRERIAGLESRVAETPKNEQELLALTRDHENLAATYERLLSNKNDATLARNLEDAQMAERFSLLRPAHPPRKPSWPEPLIVLPGGIAFGLALAALAILAAELRNPAFHSVRTLEETLDLPILGSIPQLERDLIYAEPPPEGLDWRLVVHQAPRSAAAEQYRSFLPAFLEIEASSSRGQVVLVTSAAAGDGKSVTCLNLACSLATDLARKVLVIDGDLRRPSLHRLLRVEHEPGLTDVLRSRVKLGEAVLNPISSLSFLPCGRPVSNPIAALTAGEFFKLREEACHSYDVILIDSPPLLAVVDASILRRMADLVVFIVRAGSTPPSGVVRSLHQLRGVAGVIFNDVSASAFRSYYHYDAYSHYMPEDLSDFEDEVDGVRGAEANSGRGRLREG